jgi:hypothetical protein
MASYEPKCPALYEEVLGKTKEIIGALIEEAEVKFEDKTFRSLRHNLLDAMGRFSRSVDTAWGIAEAKDDIRGG